MLRDLLIALLTTAVLYGSYRWFLSLTPAQMVMVSHWLIVVMLFGATFALVRFHRMGSSPPNRDLHR